MPRPLLYTIGTFFGSGFSPFAPATAASFLFMAIWWLAWTFLGPIPLWLTLVMLGVVTLIGIPVAGQLEKIHGEDPSLVVIDEVAGMLVTYIGLSAGLTGWILGFFWFRLKNWAAEVAWGSWPTISARGFWPVWPPTAPSCCWLAWGIEHVRGACRTDGPDHRHRG